MISARVHPGEPQSSHVVEGLIRFLISDDEDAIWLRKNFVFKIIPMLNPDGVKYGNYRCSLLGFDMNRRWGAPNKFLDPTVFHLKSLIWVFSEERHVKLYYDLHGHSRWMNSFIFACTFDNNHQHTRIKNALIRQIPSLLSKRNQDFSYRQCTFNIEKVKEHTGRVVSFWQFGIRFAYTVECSFFGR